MMLANDIVGDGQSESGASFLGGDERLEDMRQDLRVNAGTGVFDRKLDLPRLWQALDADDQASPRLHDIDGIHEQVQHDLPDLLGNAQNYWQLGFRVEFKNDILVAHLGGGQRADILDDNV